MAWSVVTYSENWRKDGIKYIPSCQKRHHFRGQILKQMKETQNYQVLNLITVKPHLSGHSFIGIFTYRDILFLLQLPLLVHSDIVCRCFICRSFIMSIFLHTFVLYIPSLPLLNVNIQQESWQPTMRL